MELNPQQKRKMMEANSDASLGERPVDRELRRQRSKRISVHTLDKLHNKEENTPVHTMPLRVRRMPGNGSFC